LREARGGGSVPPLYMDNLRVWERRGKLTIVDNEDPVFVRTNDDGGDGGMLWISMRDDFRVTMDADRICHWLRSTASCWYALSDQIARPILSSRRYWNVL
jgi:hypothetical protein